MNKSVTNKHAAEERRQIELLIRARVNRFMLTETTRGILRDPDAKIAKEAKLHLGYDNISKRMLSDISNMVGVTITTADIGEVKTYGNLLNVILRKLNPPKVAKDKEKPSVNEVSQAFHDLHADIRRIMSKPGSLRNVLMAQAELDAAHAKLREKLQGWGIADMIDWDRED